MWAAVFADRVRWNLKILLRRGGLYIFLATPSGCGAPQPVALRRGLGMYRGDFPARPSWHGVHTARDPKKTIPAAMMDPVVKIALTLCVLAGGVCAASWFRRDAPPVPVAQETDEELLLQCRASQPPPVENRGEEGRGLVEVLPATVVSPSSNRHETPPSLSPNYPRSQHWSDPQQSASMAMMLPVGTSGDATARTHTVVDGDTLDALARRYFGSAARADDIYRANREVLSDPHLLPIGAELKLPGR